MIKCVCVKPVVYCQNSDPHKPNGEGESGLQADASERRASKVEFDNKITFINTNKS